MLKQIAPDILEIMSRLTVVNDTPQDAEIRNSWKLAAELARDRKQDDASSATNGQKGTA